MGRIFGNRIEEVEAFGRHGLEGGCPSTNPIDSDHPAYHFSNQLPALGHGSNFRPGGMSFFWVVEQAEWGGRHERQVYCEDAHALALADRMG